MKRARLNPPTVLLDASFLTAVTTANDEHHGAAVQSYRELVIDFRNDRVLLVALAPVLRSFDRMLRTSLFAPVAALHIGGRTRRAAERMVADIGRPERLDLEFDLDQTLATTLVVIHRERVDRVATFDERLQRFDVTLVAPRDDRADSQSSAA